MVFVLDEYLLAITFLVSFGINLLFYVFAAGFKMDKLTDITYALSFIALAILAFCLTGTYYVRQCLMLGAVLLWGVRVGGYLLFRILKIGHDKRFDPYRASWWRFGIFWLFQSIVVWLTFLPSCLLFANAADFVYEWRDALGYSLFVVGWLVETVADQQKFAFRNNKANDGRWTDIGLWSWSRHPNYAGELMVWWGLFSVSATSFVGADWKYFSIIGPALLTLSILFFSGITRLEEAADKRYWHDPAYQTYKRRTSPLIPLPPPLYAPLPGLIKRFLLFEFAMYSHPQPLVTAVQPDAKAKDKPKHQRKSGADAEEADGGEQKHRHRASGRRARAESHEKKRGRASTPASAASAAVAGDKNVAENGGTSDVKREKRRKQRSRKHEREAGREEKETNANESNSNSNSSEEETK
jgi:steroid 5-alpha reductase family enzyme